MRLVTDVTESRPFLFCSALNNVKRIVGFCRFSDHPITRSPDFLKLGYFSGEAEDGEVFAFELEGKDRIPVLEWTAPDRLRISCLRCSNSSIKKREERWQSVRVFYEIAGP